MTLRELREETKTPVIVADDQGFVTYVNAPFEATFGWKSQEIIGKLLTLIIPHTLRDAHHLGFSRFLNTERSSILSRPLRLKALDKSGREFDCEHVIVAEKEDGRWTFGATLRPLGNDDARRWPEK